MIYLVWELKSYWGSDSVIPIILVLEFGILFPCPFYITTWHIGYTRAWTLAMFAKDSHWKIVGAKCCLRYLRYIDPNLDIIIFEFNNSRLGNYWSHQCIRVLENGWWKRQDNKAIGVSIFWTVVQITWVESWEPLTLCLPTMMNMIEPVSTVEQTSPQEEYHHQGDSTPTLATVFSLLLQDGSYS